MCLSLQPKMEKGEATSERRGDILEDGCLTKSSLRGLYDQHLGIV